MRLLLNLHYSRTRNVGDLCSLPIRYFKFPIPSQQWDLYTRWPDREQVALIFGGGGVDSSAQHVSIIKRYVRHHSGLTVAWGVGTHLDRTDYGSADTLRCFKVVGTRDWPAPTGSDWVPCASCMLDAFDEAIVPSHEVVVYEQEKRPTGIAGLPKMNTHVPEPVDSRGNAVVRAARPNEAMDWARRSVRFLASGKVVVTSSYHGAYWALLLGKKVIAIPPQVGFSKFHFFRHPPALCQASEWKEHLSSAPSYGDLLPAYREANRQFHAKVLEAMNGRT